MNPSVFVSDLTFIDVVAESSYVLENVVAVASDKLVMEYTEDVKSKLAVHNLQSGVLLKDLDIPLGAIKQISGRRYHFDFLFKIESFNTPGTIYDVDMESGSFELTRIRDITVRYVLVASLSSSPEFEY